MKTLAELKEKYGENWGLNKPERKDGPQFKAPTADQLRFHYQHHGLAFTQKAGADDNDTATQETIQSLGENP